MSLQEKIDTILSELIRKYLEENYEGLFKYPFAVMSELEKLIEAYSLVKFENREEK